VKPADLPHAVLLDVLVLERAFTQRGALAELAGHQHRAPTTLRRLAVVGHVDDRLQIEMIVELAELQARVAAQSVEVLAHALLADVDAVL